MLTHSRNSFVFLSIHSYLPLTSIIATTYSLKFMLFTIQLSNLANSNKMQTEYTWTHTHRAYQTDWGHFVRVYWLAISNQTPVYCCFLWCNSQFDKMCVLYCIFDVEANKEVHTKQCEPKETITDLWNSTTFLCFSRRFMMLFLFLSDVLPLSVDLHSYIKIIQPFGTMKRVFCYYWKVILSIELVMIGSKME